MDFPIQKYSKIIGSDGCYFSCIVKLAEKYTKKEFDVLRTLDYCSKQKKNGHYWIDISDCYLWHPDKVMGYLLGKEVTVRRSEDIGYKPKENEIVIGCWERPTEDKVYTHFGLVKNQKCIYDPLGTSNTITYGKLKSLRIFTIL